MKKTKKKKPTIRGLQNTIEKLNQGIEEYDRVVKNLENNDYSIRKEISDILEKRDEFGGYRGGTSNSVKSWSDIKASISRLTGLATKEGQMSSRINYMMDAENARLWYLMRVVIRDPNLQVPVRPDQMRDIFGNEPPRENR